MSELPIVFMGTAELSCASLQALLGHAAFRVRAVVTQPDRPKGRDLKLQPSPVKQLALKANLPVLQPERARDEAFVWALRALQPDLIVVAAYGQILPRSILDLPRFGCINVHTSLLPKYRGAAPIQSAILNGDPVTGVTIMKMDAGLDTGDILTQESTPIAPEDDAAILHDRLATMGAGLLVRTIPDYVAGRVRPTPQPAQGATYAPKIKKQDGQIDWNQSAIAICNRVRALTPWPGCFTFIASGSQARLLKLWQVRVVSAQGAPGQVLQADTSRLVVACRQDALSVETLQIEGGRRLGFREFLAGHPLPPGELLSSPNPNPNRT